MNNKINSIVKEKNITIPLYMYRLIPKLGIDTDTFMFLMYLHSMGEKVEFDPQKACVSLGIDLKNVMNYIDILTSKNLITFEKEKDKNITNEYISLSNYYEKVNILLMEEDNSKPKDAKSVFNLIEKEFGRLLSPIENEIVKAWLESNISEELIEEALKEAVYNGVTNLRYIDKILYEYQKLGINSKEDVIKHKTKNNKDKKEDNTEVFEYDWLNDEE